MNLIRKDAKSYTFRSGRGSITLPRVSRILEWYYGPIKADPERLKWLAKFGTMVHASIDRKKPLPGTEDHVRDAHDFMRAINFETKRIEEVVVSKKWKFAGTVDRTGVTGNRWVLIDWKTGALGERGETQINLYDLAWLETTGKKLDDLYGVQLTGKGFKAKRIERNWKKALDIVQGYHESGRTK